MASRKIATMSHRQLKNFPNLGLYYAILLCQTVYVNFRLNFFGSYAENSYVKYASDSQWIHLKFHCLINWKGSNYCFKLYLCIKNKSFQEHLLCILIYRLHQKLEIFLYGKTLVKHQHQIIYQKALGKK